MNKKIKSALNVLGIQPFRVESYNPLNDAQRNLQGLTHFVDANTLKGFRARVLNAQASHEGLIYWIIESVGKKPFDGKANKRFVAFDVFGDVISDRDSWHTTSKAAEKIKMRSWNLLTLRSTRKADYSKKRNVTRKTLRPSLMFLLKSKIHYV